MTVDEMALQSAEHEKNKESHSAEKNDKAKQVADKTASEVKLTADVKVLTSEKVAVVFSYLSCWFKINALHLYGLISTSVSSGPKLFVLKPNPVLNANSIPNPISNCSTNFCIFPFENAENDMI